MRRLTSVLHHALPAMAALGLLATTPAWAQTPEPPPAMPPGIVMPAALPGAGPQTPGQPPTVSPKAQQGQATTPPASAPRPETPRPPSIGSANAQPLSSATNIKLDLLITDTYTGTPVKKTVSLLMLNGHSGMIRTSGSDGWSVLNVDAVAGAWSNGQVSLRMTFEYTPAQTKPDQKERAPRLNESITVVLQDGKPMMVSQSADPATDRKVTAELTATILK